jgi:GDSL-like lipase/acylhydrolase family protein
VIFRYFKTIAYKLITKACSKNQRYSDFTRCSPSTNRGNTNRIMIIGDSNSFRPERSNISWPKLLEDKDPLHLNIFNESCDGRTTRYDNGEYNGFNVIRKKLTAHAPLGYVVIMLGTNDVKNKYGPPSPAEECISPVIDDLKKCGILLEDDKIIFQDAKIIPYANVIFDLDRATALATVQGYLDDIGIIYCGRYGEWGYHWTDEAFVSGENAARKILDQV